MRSIIIIFIGSFLCSIPVYSEENTAEITVEADDTQDNSEKG